MLSIVSSSLRAATQSFTRRPMAALTSTTTTSITSLTSNSSTSTLLLPKSIGMSFPALFHTRFLNAIFNFNQQVSFHWNCCLKYLNFCFQFGPRSREAGDPHEETQAGPGQHQEEGRKAEEEPKADGQEGRAHAQVQRTLGSSESSQVKKIVTYLI